MGLQIDSLELIGYDPETDTFPSTVFSNLSPQPLPYRASCNRARPIGPPSSARSPNNEPMERVNIFSAENLEGRVDVGRAVGSTETLMFIADLVPGQGSSPYHYEFEEEWLLVVDGTIVLRAPDGEHTLERGDLVRFPPGPAGAHKLMNRSDSPARTLMFSSSRSQSPAVVIYPDSDTVGVFPGDEKDEMVFRRDTAVPWAYGEEGWDKAL
jgi:uncharacterized cupin superfamily protein